MLRTENKRNAHKVVTRPSAATITKGSRQNHGQGSSVNGLPTTGNRDGAGTGSQKDRCYFFELLPIELRLEIYEILLRSPDDILITPHRRQLYAKRPDKFKKGKFFIDGLTHTMPHVEFLRTCKQVDREATPILYGKNTFFVALPKIGAPFDPTATFLWYMRKSTIAQLGSITFLHGCYCPGWLIACSPIRKPVAAKRWTATGKQLSKLYFPHYSLPHWMPLGKNSRDAYEYICRKILEDKTASSTGYICGQCRNSRKLAATLESRRRDRARQQGLSLAR